MLSENVSTYVFEPLFMHLHLLCVLVCEAQVCAGCAPMWTVEADRVLSLCWNYTSMYCNGGAVDYRCVSAYCYVKIV